MDLVLDEKVDQRDQGSEKEASQQLAVLDGRLVWRRESEAAEGPGKGEDEVRDHKDVVPVVVVGRGDVNPAAAENGPDETDRSHKLGRKRAGLCGEQVPEAN